MSLVTGTARTGEAAAAAEAPLFNGIPLILGTIAINVFYVGVRIYEQVFGQFAGLDSFAPEFTTYWMTILYIEEPVELISFLALVGWMWKTRDTDLEHVQPAGRNAPHFLPAQLDFASCTIRASSFSSHIRRRLCAHAKAPAGVFPKLGKPAPSPASPSCPQS